MKVFVEFETLKDCNETIVNLNDAELDGNKLRVYILKEE